jgi:hypothetical protein
MERDVTAEAVALAAAGAVAGGARDGAAGVPAGGGSAAWAGAGACIVNECCKVGDGGESAPAK